MHLLALGAFCHFNGFIKPELAGPVLMHLLALGAFCQMGKFLDENRKEDMS